MPNLSKIAPKYELSSSYPRPSRTSDQAYIPPASWRSHSPTLSSIKAKPSPVPKCRLYVWCSDYADPRRTTDGLIRTQAGPRVSHITYHHITKQIVPLALWFSFSQFIFTIFKFIKFQNHIWVPSYSHEWFQSLDFYRNLSISMNIFPTHASWDISGHGKVTVIYASGFSKQLLI
jgi:hypothetical protein